MDFSDSNSDISLEDEEKLKEIYFKNKPLPQKIDPKNIVKITATATTKSVQLTRKYESYAAALKTKKKSKFRTLYYYKQM